MARVGLILLGWFFAVATAILLTAGLSLLVPGPLDAIWSLTPDKLEALRPVRGLAGAGFLVLAPLMAAASYGVFRRRPWARWLAIAILTANGLGDLAQLVVGNWMEAAVGVTATGLLVFWLTRRDTVTAFGNRR